MRPPPDATHHWRGLYAITPEAESNATLLRDVELALAGGCRWLQYRDKTSRPEQRRERALALRAACQTHGAKLLINDDLALAIAVDADGVHLGREDGDLAAARDALGRHKIIGASCYGELELAHQAVAAGADYLAFGALFPSPTKPGAPSAPLSLLGAARLLGRPVCAIGGITLANAPQAIAAGADLLAVITDLFSAPDIAARASAYQSLFKETA